MNILTEMGFFAYPILAIALAILFIAGKKFRDLYIVKRVIRRQSEEHMLNAILVLAVIMVAVGFTATVMGFSSVMRVILTARELDPSVVTRSIASSLLPVIVSLLALSVSSIVWFVLRLRFMSLIEKTDTRDR